MPSRTKGRHTQNSRRPSCLQGCRHQACLFSGGTARWGWACAKPLLCVSDSSLLMQLASAHQKRCPPSNPGGESCPPLWAGHSPLSPPATWPSKRYSWTQFGVLDSSLSSSPDVESTLSFLRPTHSRPLPLLEGLASFLVSAVCISSPLLLSWEDSS